MTQDLQSELRGLRCQFKFTSKADMTNALVLARLLGKDSFLFLVLLCDDLGPQDTIRTLVEKKELANKWALALFQDCRKPNEDDPASVTQPSPYVQLDPGDIKENLAALLLAEAAQDGHVDRTSAAVGSCVIRLHEHYLRHGCPDQGWSLVESMVKELAYWDCDDRVCRLWIAWLRDSYFWRTEEVQPRLEGMIEKLTLEGYAIDTRVRLNLLEWMYDILIRGHKFREARVLVDGVIEEFEWKIDGYNPDYEDLDFDDAIAWLGRLYYCLVREEKPENAQAVFANMSPLIKHLDHLNSRYVPWLRRLTRRLSEEDLEVGNLEESMIKDITHSDHDRDDWHISWVDRQRELFHEFRLRKCCRRVY